MRFNWLVLTVVALLAGPAFPRDEGPRSDKHVFQGEWKPVSVRTDGADVTALLAKVTDGSDLITFDGDTMVSMQGGQKKSLPFKLNPACEPKELDLEAGDGKTVIRAIYDVDGDDLTITFSLSGNQERPTDFATKSGSQTMTWAYKRHKR